MKKAIALMAGAALALTLAGCGGQAEEAPEDTQEAPESTQAIDDETQAGNELAAQLAGDSGPGTMTLVTEDSTSEGGNIPQLASSADSQTLQIEVNYEGGDGSAAELYVDGEQVETITASEQFTVTIDLTGSMLDKGEHMVELVAMDGDDILIHKTARYEIV